MDLSLIFALLWVSLALCTGMLLSKLMKLINFPNVTGFLIAGIIIGPWLIGLVNQDLFNKTITNLSWVSEIALGFIAFTIGGSFKISALKKIGKKATIISVFEALGASLIVMVALFIAYFLGLKDKGLNPAMILILGAIACATAPAATLMVINQYKARGPVTETLIPVVAFDDAVALIAFAILFSLAKIVGSNATFDPISGLLIPLLEIIMSLIVGAIMGFIISLASRWFHSRHNRLILCLMSVLFCVAICQINTQTAFNWNFSFQMSSLLTIMALGGVYANFSRGITTTSEYLDKLTNPLFMVFFILSGARLDFSVFASENAILVLIIAITYVISRVIGKWLGALLGAKASKCEKNVQKYLGLALIPQAGVALGLAGNAQTYFSSTEYANLGILIYTIIIVSTIIYELTGPIITKIALTKAGEIQKD